MWSARERALPPAIRGIFRLPSLLPALVSVKAGGIPRPRLLWSYGEANTGYLSRSYLEEYEGGFQGLTGLLLPDSLYIS